MKKKIILISLGAVFTLVLGYFIYNSLSTELINIDSEQSIVIRDLSQLELESDLIVKAKVIGKSEQKLIYSEEIGDVVYGYNITPIEIEKVYSGDDVNLGDIINIVEEYYTGHYPNGKKYIWAIENYNPAKKGNQYIFFLKKCSDLDEDTKGMYFPLGVEKGKYLINDKTKDISNIKKMSNEELEIGTWDSSEYKNILIDVFKKYND